MNCFFRRTYLNRAPMDLPGCFVSIIFFRETKRWSAIERTTDICIRYWATRMSVFYVGRTPVALCRPIICTGPAAVLLSQITRYLRYCRVAPPLFSCLIITIDRQQRRPPPPIPITLYWFDEPRFAGRITFKPLDYPMFSAETVFYFR